MRIAEKTLELSIIAQLTERLRVHNAIWLGLTQKEEKNWGFDAASAIGGTLFVLQFKASNTVMSARSIFAGSRRFKLPHIQLTRLQVIAAQFPDAVYYVFPHIGNEDELAQNQDLISQTWLLDVAQLPDPFPEPSSANHYAYMAPPACEIRSKPVQAKMRPLTDLVRLVSAARQAGDVPPDKAVQGVAERSEGNAARLTVALRALPPKGRRLYGLLIPPLS